MCIAFSDRHFINLLFAILHRSLDYCTFIVYSSSSMEVINTTHKTIHKYKIFLLFFIVYTLVFGPLGTHTVPSEEGVSNTRPSNSFLVGVLTDLLI